MAKSMCRMICKHLSVTPNSEEMFSLYAASLIYVFRVSYKGKAPAFEYQNAIRKHCTKVSAKTFRLKIHAYRNLTLGLKLFLFRLAKTRAATDQQVADWTRELELSRTDANNAYHLFKECSWFRKDVKDAAVEFDKEVALFGYSDVDAQFESMRDSLLKYAKHITWKKLRFLVKANNEQFEDFHSRLLMKAVQAMYTLVPTMEPDAYVQNYLKRVIHNQAINLIKSGTSKKHGRLRDDGFDRNNQRSASLLEVSHNQMRLITDEAGNEVTPDSEDPSCTLDKTELRFSISEIVGAYKQGSRRRRMLMILLGSEDEEFTTHLRMRKLVTSEEDNVDFQARCSVPLFNSLLCDFLGMRDNYALKFMSKIKTLLDIDMPVVQAEVAEEAVMQPMSLGFDLWE